MKKAPKDQGNITEKPTMIGFPQFDRIIYRFLMIEMRQFIWKIRGL